jgi:hypothetical protein
VIQKGTIFATVAVVLIYACLGFSFLNGNIGSFCQIISCLILCYLNGKSKIKYFYVTKNKLIIIGVTSILWMWHGRENNLYGFLSVLIQVTSISTMFFLNNETLLKVAQWFAKSFSIVSCVSLLFWVLHLLGISFIAPQKIMYLGLYELNDYFFFFKSEESVFPRFQCLFSEPGEYGMLCVICILIRGFKKDRYTVILLAAALFSLSLASYLLLAIILFFKYVIQKRKFKSLFIPVIILGGFYILGTTYNDGDNIINNAILWRLTLNDDNQLEYYNRRTVEFDSYYDKEIQDYKLISGIGQQEYTIRQFENSVDYKGYIALDGLVGLCLFVTLYLLIYRYIGNSCNTFLSFVIFVIIFIRGFVFSFSPGSLILYFLTLWSAKNQNSLSYTYNV